MLKLKSSLLLIIIFSIFCLKSTYAQLSKKHYIPPLTYAGTGNANAENQFFYISTPKNQNVSFTIKHIGSPGNDITGLVSSTSPQEIFIDDGGDDDNNGFEDSQLFIKSDNTSLVTTNKGYIIEADDVIYVSVRVLAGGGAQAGALVSKGASALGTTFRAGMFTNENPQTNYLNFISVMATENNTTVTFDDIPAGIAIKNYTGSLPISISLNEGESYIVATNAAENTVNRDGLIGTLINSDKPIVTNTGSANGSFHNGGGRDYGIDQIVGIDKLIVSGKPGSEYIFVKGDGNDNWENILIIAHEDNTTVSINGGGTFATLNKGEHIVIEGNEYNSNGNMFVETSKPTFAYQGIGANNSEANQGLFFVPPLSCENRGKVDNIPTIESIGTVTFTGGITIVTNKGATVNINSQPIANFSTSGPFDVDGNANYVTYKVTNLTGNISIDSSGELYCAYFNQNGAATSGSFYSGFPSSPEINFDAAVSTLGNCIPNVTLEAANTELFDEFEWFFDDETGGGFVSTGNTNPTYTPTIPGRYQLVGKIICSGATFKSVEVPVSICPDDYDGDTIIDNLDSDLDNDGILNCDESMGNAIFNIADIKKPIISLMDGSSDNSTSSIYTETETSNSFTGDNMGNFSSVINPATDTKLIYELAFAQNINFKFTQNKTLDHTVSNGEFFIIKIGPNNKNITLLDPDDQLLIDTNFDGDFETGVTNISASEIHFKYAANTTGATSTFEFVANQIKQIDFKHQSTGITATSTFNGNFQLTCFSRDSDGDGIEDALDLDSDNDGIPDFNETSNDLDGDGIANYIDIDSDNDGIFDLQEAGHNLNDGNLDGAIDNANTSIGINGLVDNLETTPDDKALSINYTIRDSDSDSNFDFIESDADNDACNDTTEAGFTDSNGDGFLGGLPIQIDTKGKVINITDGYTSPNPDYINSAPITLNSTFNDVAFCENSIETISINSTADSFQWQVSTDNTTWNNIANNTIYNGVTTSTLQVSNIPLTYNNYRFRVLLSRTGNGCKNQESNALTLTVNPLPIPKENPTELKQCDSDQDKQTTFNLTLVEPNISDNSKDTFQYFATEVNAIAGSPQVADKTSYFVDTTGEAWVRTISEFGCYTISKINLTVSYTPNEPYEETFLECDDFLDVDGNNTSANSDTDGITSFDFSIAPSQISSDPDIKIEFYETEQDRTQSINEIQLSQNIAQYRNKNIPNTTGNRFPIYYKLISKSNNDCSGLGQIYLQIKPVPLATSPADFNFCDDALSGSTTDGRNAGTNLRDRVTDILGPTQTETNYIVSFHTTATGANTNTDVITNDTNYTNEAPAGFTQGDISEQTIFIRVQDRNGTPQCFNDHESFKIIVNPIPVVATTITPLAVCDVTTPSDSDPRNRVAQNIDLTTQNAEILTGKTNHRVAYFVTQQDAENGINEIANPTDFQNVTSQTTFPSDFNTDNPGIETIFFTIIDLGGNMCSSVFSTFQLLIYPEPNIPINISDYSDCDNTSDADADDSNGRNGDISLKNKIPEILANYQPSEFADFSVTFYPSLAQAETGDPANAIDENIFENITNNLTIFVRVENTKNTPVACVHTRLSFNINIRPLPSFIVMGEENIDTPQIVCLNDTPLTLEAENPAATYDYVWTDEAGAVLGNARTLDVTVAGKYTVTATDQTLAAIACSRARTIVVKESNIATLQQSFITIIDESNNIGSQDKISVSIDTTSNDLGPGDYQFAIRNDDNGDRIPAIGFQDAPLFENLDGGVYTVIVNDKNGCSADTELQISVIQFPKFFTPNGDGNNDTWVIKGANKTFYPNSSINIFNRFGKLVAQIPIDGQGWNGTYNGKILPTDDYWFNIQLIPADTSKSPILKKGHFSLLRTK